jgi:hypothetical protein
MNRVELFTSSPQRIYDEVAQHLLRQMERSNGSNGCAYNATAEDGRVLHCALGIFLTDEALTPEENGMPWDSLCGVRGWRTTHLKFLNELQDIHDAKEPSEWEDSLREFAERHELVSWPRG